MSFGFAQTWNIVSSWTIVLDWWWDQELSHLDKIKKNWNIVGDNQVVIDTKDSKSQEDKEPVATDQLPLELEAKVLLEDVAKIPIIDHEIVPLILQEVIEEIEYCEDGSEKQEMWVDCDDWDIYTKNDIISDDWCTCLWVVPPITVINNPNWISYNEEGLAILNSVRSIDVAWWWAPYCSMIARLNLKQFYPSMKYVSWLGSPNLISMGDAVTLIKAGQKNWKLTQILTRDLQSTLDNSWEDVVDIYLYTELWLENSEKRYLQWHRSVAFKASDLRRYILDPLRWSTTTKPQVLRDYIYHYSNKSSQFYVYTELTNTETIFTSQDEGLLIDAACEIKVHESRLMSHELSLFQSEQVCFDILEVCW